MAATSAPWVETDPSERLSADDMASRTEAAFLELALHVQAVRALRERTGFPGVCTNCGSTCAPAAVYCDEDCRSDHEARERVRSQIGAPDR